MKFFTTLLTLGAAALVSSWNFNKDDCQKHHPKAYDNINRFCAITNMEVPSAYASTGRYGPSKSRVWISPVPANSCRPAQWVPSSICYSQLYSMCANHEKTRFYGRNLCQMWRIQYATGAVKPGISDKWPFKSIMVPIKRARGDDGNHAYGLLDDDNEQDAPVAA